MVSIASLIPACGDAKLLMASAVFFGLSTSVGLAAEDRLARVLDNYSCQVRVMLSAIKEAPASVAKPFLIVAVTDKFAKNLTCAFVDNRQHLSCETAPISKEKAEGAPFYKISQRGGAALGKLDFAMNDVEGTFQRTIDLASHQDLKPIAQLMLSALYAAYGMRDPDAGLSLVADHDSLSNFDGVTACPGEYKTWGIALR